MSDYDNTNRGVLFREQNRKSDRHPEYTGKIDVNGTEYRLAAWVKESKNGRKFFSLSVSEIRERNDDAAPPVDDDSEIPF